ncbi:MAG: transglutaminase domain-containing protein [Alphaproteobacteria bacterium]
MVAAYARHSRWSDPGAFAVRLDDLPADPAALPEVVGGLVLHPLFAPAGTDTAEASLRSIPEILAALLARNDRPLDRPREPGKRVISTCRSYALLACAALRDHGAPARLRVGFADYFTPDFWEDHWVCEYRHGDAWRLLDAELTAELRRRVGIGLDPADVPRDRFLSVGQAWLALRRGEHDPARFGVSILGIRGLWFVAGSLLRDLAALAMEEMMPWDCWGPARDFRPDKPVPPEWLGPLDSLAAALAREPVTYDDVQAILAAHPWAALTPSVLSFPEGKPVEVALDRW